MSEREPLAVVDTAWLRMDRPTNLMMICGMFTFAERVELGELKQVIQNRMLCFHRFQQRIVDQESNPHWETYRDFDLDWHVRHIAPPIAVAGDGLEAVASDLMSTPLDPTKPMWQFHLIDLADGSALILRIHHCYGDGFALSYVVSCMTDVDPAKPRSEGKDLVDAGPLRSAWETILGPVAESVGDVLRSGRSVLDVGFDLLDKPEHAIKYLKAGADLAYQSGVIANMAPDSPTRFKGELGVMKRVAWAQPLSLFEVQALSKALACSVNDILVACITGAFRNFLIEQGELKSDAEMRALIPVNLRPPGPVTELGNRFGLVFLSLPIGIDDPLERVAEVHKRMNELKNSQQPLVALGILAALGVAPPVIKERVLEALAANASAVITNVIGSQEKRYLAGKTIVRQMFWVPQSGGIGVGVSLLSYAGSINFGLVTDTRRVPDPVTIVKHFMMEFESLLFSTLMGPWPTDTRRRERSKRKVPH